MLRHMWLTALWVRWLNNSGSVISFVPRHITGSLFNPVVQGHGNMWHWTLCSGGPPSLLLKVIVVNYSVAAEKKNDSEEKGADTYKASTSGDKIIIPFFMQIEGGTEFSCSTDLFLVWCHPHRCSPVWFSLWQTGYTSLALPIQPEGKCSVMHVTLPPLLLRQRHVGR